MSCKKAICPEGLSVCCGECIRKEMGQCEGCCEHAENPKACIDYIDWYTERKKKTAERKTDRNLTRYAIALLLFVVLLFIYTCFGMRPAAAHIADIKNGLPAATEQSYTPINEHNNN